MFEMPVFDFLTSGVSLQAHKVRGMIPNFLNRNASVVFATTDERSCLEGH